MVKKYLFSFGIFVNYLLFFSFLEKKLICLKNPVLAEDKWKRRADQERHSVTSSKPEVLNSRILSVHLLETFSTYLISVYIGGGFYNFYYSPFNFTESFDFDFSI